MPIRIKPVKPKLVTDQVYEQLREIIFRGEVKPGEKLMPERELAAALGVSRPTLKNAINKLVVTGLVEQRQGQGTFVRSASANGHDTLRTTLEDAGLMDLLEVRMGLECNAAAYAALRAVDKDLEFMKNNLEAMEKETSEGGLGTEADVAFHMAISYATQNPVQVHLMRSFYDFLFAGIHENLKYLYEQPGNIEKIVDQHRQIYKAIRKHDPNMALETMRRHIQFVLDFFKSRED